MPRQESTAARAVRQISDLDAVYERLKDPSILEKRLDDLRAKRDYGYESLGGSAREAAEREMAPRRPPADVLAKNGRSALEKVKRHKDKAVLSPTEEFALEAIVLLEGRPALLVQNGRFQDPPPEWAVLNQHRASIEAMLGSVGRIEVTGHPSLDWVGTGFLIGEGVVITNRHVAKEFSRQKGAGWVFESGMKARIDYAEELGSPQPAEFSLTEVIGIHDAVDLALLRAAKKGGAQVPRPLVLPKKPMIAKGQKIYAVGYPAWDGHRNEPEPMSRIFHDVYNVKRLQPGEIEQVSAPRKELQHDCSTLGGNSGSCIVDLATQRVIGLHFGGRYRQANYAVILSKLQGDALLKKAKVEFS